MKTNKIGLSVPAVRAASTTSFSAHDQPSRIQIGTLLPSTTNAPHRLVDRAIEQLIPLELDRGIVVVELRLPVTELAVPIASFARLETVLVADEHEDALVAQPLQLILDFCPQLAVVGGQVINQQIGEVVFGGANADVGASFALQFAD